MGNISVSALKDHLPDPVMGLRGPFLMAIQVCSLLQCGRRYGSGSLILETRSNM